MPVGAAGHARALGIRFVMTAHAVQSCNALASRTTDDVGEVAVAIIALLWIIRGGVTVQAAGANQYRIDLLPRSQSVSVTCAGTFRVAAIAERAGDKRRGREYSQEERCQQGSSMT